MRIVLVTRRYPPLIGGAEKVLSYLASALSVEGANVVVVTSALGGQGSRLDEGGVPVVRLATSRVRFMGTWLYMGNLRRWFERNPVDLAYVSMLKHDAYVAVGEGRRLGFPVVLRPEGAGATGDLAWQSWGRFGERIGERCKQADAVVAISGAVHDELLQAGYEPTKVVDLPNGVPIPTDPWQRREGWRDAPRAVFIGRLASEKSLDTLVRAWRMVRQIHPKATLGLVGEGPDRHGLETLIAELGLLDAVRLPGSTSDATSSLRSADLFVLPSREEGMSIALLEAMALGMPLVATSIPGNRRLLVDFEHGRLVPPGDADALGRTILDQWANFDSACQMALAARQRVVHEFSIASVARRHLDLFRTLLQDRDQPDGL